MDIKIMVIPNLQTRPPILKYRPTRPDHARACVTNVCLESILRNKAPVELQPEVKEITTDGSV